jgi:hypothetical protein
MAGTYSERTLLEADQVVVVNDVLDLLHNSASQIFRDINYTQVTTHKKGSIPSLFPYLIVRLSVIH